MRKLIVLLTFAFLFSISYSLTLDSFYANYSYVLSYPIIHYRLSALNDVEIYSVSLNLSEPLNYVPLYPNAVGANQTGDFEFKLSQVPCSLYGKTIEANLTVNSSDGVQYFDESFFIGNPLESKTNNSFAVRVGETYTVLLNLKNKGDVPLNLTVSESTPHVIYTTYITKNGFSDKLNSPIIFKLTYPIKINFIGAEVGDGIYQLNLTDSRCSNITLHYKANVRVYTLSSGIFSYKTMDTQIGILFLILSVVLIAKLIKIER